VTLTELMSECPGLFRDDVCETQAQAERYADALAAKLGLGTRATSRGEADNARVLEYRDPRAVLLFHVEIVCDPNSRSNPIWLFRCSAERSDCQLKIQSPHRLRAKPSAFQREAKEMIQHLRSVKLDASGRLLGRLTRWDWRRGRGLLECVPGAVVPLQTSDLTPDARRALRQFNWFSFQIEQTTDGQKAIAVRPVLPSELHECRRS
jgi:hypothetical protein